MSVNVRIPTPLRNLTGGQDVVSVAGKTIAEIFKDLENKHPGIGERLCDANGEIRRFVNVYHNEEDIRFKEGRNTPVTDGDEVSIVPAIAGGC